MLLAVDAPHIGRSPYSQPEIPTRASAADRVSPRIGSCVNYLVDQLDATMAVSEEQRFVMADGSATAWDVLSDSSRRHIVAVLAEQPRPVGELSDRLPISGPALSQHLRVLEEAGVVADEVRGTQRVYRVDSVALSALKDQLDTFWGRALAGFSEAAHASVDDKQRRRRSGRA